MHTFFATASALLLSTSLAAAAMPQAGSAPAKPTASEHANPAKAAPATPAAAPAKAHALSRRRVEEIQAALNNKGAGLAVDGIWGPKTQAAVEHFQKQNHLKVTGRADQATMDKLQPPHWG